MEKQNQPPETTKPKKFWQSFMEFLRQYSVIGLAIGVVMGSAVNSLVQSIVQGLITPLISLIIPGENVGAIMFSVRGSEFKIGDVISALLQFIIISLLIYVTVKFLLRQEELLKKK